MGADIDNEASPGRAAGEVERGVLIKKGGRERKNTNACLHAKNDEAESRSCL